MSVGTEQPVAFQIPDALNQLIDQIPSKDRERIREAIRRLHETNGSLWTAEDRVRAASGEDAVATKRAIDQLNRKRNDLVDRIDEGFTHLSTQHLVRPSTPIHTETIGSVVDRYSVVNLRERRAELLAQDATNEGAVDRLRAVSAQRAELAKSIADLAADLKAGARRLPDGRKFKLYGTISETVGQVTVSPNIDQVIALGGLSECGKSSSGEYLRHQDGTYRLKMSFLLDIAAKRSGIEDLYLLDRPSQARLLLEGLNLFADMHVEARRFTIESVHSDELIFTLKQMLGDRLEIVFLEAPAHLRAARSQTTRAALRAKDEIKTSRGADRVAAGADHVVDNGGAVVSLHARLRTIANPRSSSPVRVERAMASFLPEPIAAEVDAFVAAVAAGPGVDLVALTGSTVNGEWMSGWSDIDLLVSAEHSVHRVAAQEAGKLQVRLGGAEQVKCALTLVTPGEISALFVQPGVVYALFRLGDGRSTALFAAPGLRLPVITSDKFKHAATQTLPLVFVTLRRLVAASTSGSWELRPIYKHIVLALQLLLRANGVDATGANAIADMGEEVLAGLGSLDLPAAAAIAGSRARGSEADHADAVIRAAHRLLEWYAAQVNPDFSAVSTRTSGDSK